MNKPFSDNMVQEAVKKKHPAFIDIKFHMIKKNGTGTVYANLVCAKTDNVMIQADLNYIVRAATERNIEITNLQGALNFLLENFDLRVK